MNGAVIEVQRVRREKLFSFSWRIEVYVSGGRKPYRTEGGICFGRKQTERRKKRSVKKLKVEMPNAKVVDFND